MTLEEKNRHRRSAEKRYEENNRETHLAGRARHRQKHREVLRRKQRDRMRADPAAQAARNKAWHATQQDHPDPQRRLHYRLGRWLATLRQSAKKRGLDFNLSRADLPTIPAICPVLGVPLSPATGSHALDNSPSVDRVDNRRGYVPGNVRIISFRANTIKGSMTLAEAKLLVAYMEKHQPTASQQDSRVVG